MRKALQVSDETLALLRAQLQSTKERYLRDSVQQLEHAIAQVTRRVVPNALSAINSENILRSA